MQTVNMVNVVMSFFYIETWGLWDFQSLKISYHFFERAVRKLNVSCSYIFLVILNHYRGYLLPILIRLLPTGRSGTKKQAG